jgi:hypothetical protein
MERNYREGVEGKGLPGWERIEGKEWKGRN